MTHITATHTTKTSEHVEVVPMGEEVELVLTGGRPHRHGAAEQGRRRHAEAVRAPGDPEELEGEAPQDLRQRQGQDAEEDPRVANAQETEQRGDEGRAEDSREDEDLHRLDLQVLDDEGHGIRPDAEVGGVPERQEARVAEEQVEAEGGDGEDEPVREQHRLVGRHDERQDGERNEDGHRPAHHATGRSGNTHARPKSPAGRMRSTTAAIR